MDAFFDATRQPMFQRWKAPNAPYAFLWSLQTSQAMTLRIIPDLHVHLIFDLNGAVSIEPMFLWAADRWLELSLPENTQWLGMAFSGWAASGLHQTFYDSLSEPWSYPAPRVALDGWAEALYFELLEAKNQQRALTSPLAWFHDAILTHLERQPSPDQRFLSERQRRRLYATRLALKPNLIERIQRFQRGLESLPTISLEYADQAHWIRECRRFSGLTPKQLLGLQRWSGSSTKML
jgi:hypothetical protein